jgi:hypothetical protein
MIADFKYAAAGSAVQLSDWDKDSVLIGNNPCDFTMLHW